MEFTSPYLITNLYEKFDIIDKQYPNSKFILNYRNIDDWIESRLNHPKNRNVSQWQYYKKCMVYYDCNKKDLIEIWKKHFYEHLENVDNYFSQNRDKVLFFELGKTNLNELIDFLPEMDFKYKHLKKLN